MNANIVVLFLTLIELFLFSLVAVIHSLYFRYSVPEAVIEGVLSMVWRVASFQLPTQVVSSLILVKLGLPLSVVLGLSASIGLVVACLVTTSGLSAFWKMFHLPTETALGPGLVMIATVGVLVLVRELLMSS
jgi:hypothetical protein